MKIVMEWEEVAKHQAVLEYDGDDNFEEAPIDWYLLSQSLLWLGKTSAGYRHSEPEICEAVEDAKVTHDWNVAYKVYEDLCDEIGLED